MTNYTLTNCNCFWILILNFLFQVLVGACVRNSYVLVTRRQPSAWLLPSSMKALSFHKGKCAKRRKSHAEVALTKGLQSAQKWVLGFSALRRAARRKVPCGARSGEQRETRGILLESPGLGNTKADNQAQPLAWEMAQGISQPALTLSYHSARSFTFSSMLMA